MIDNTSDGSDDSAARTMKPGRPISISVDDLRMFSAAADLADAAVMSDAWAKTWRPEDLLAR